MMLCYGLHKIICADVEINEQALNSLPDNGVPTDLLTVETEDHIL